MKTRFVFSAFCMLVAMTMATGAFAQGRTFQVSGGQRGAGMNGHTERAGGITLFLITGEVRPRDGNGGDRLRRPDHEYSQYHRWKTMDTTGIIE